MPCHQPRIVSAEISGCCDKIRIKFDQEAYCNNLDSGHWAGADDCQSGTCGDYGYPTSAYPGVNYYGPYTTGFWHEYESFREMAGFDGEVDTDGTIYYDFEIMYEDDLSYALVNDRVIYKSAAGADMYVVHGGMDPYMYAGCGLMGKYPGWMVVNPTTLSQMGTVYGTYMEP